MSLILEALRKLDREKGAADRGFLVVAATPWPERARRSWPLWAGAALLLAAGTGAALWPRAAARTPVRPVGAPVSSRSPAAAAATPAPALPIVPSPLRREAAPSPPALTAAAIQHARTNAVPLALATPAPVESPVPALRLQAISERDGKPIALLNDRLMREGDEFEGVRVLAIRGTEVEVEVHGRRTVLRF